MERIVARYDRGSRIYPLARHAFTLIIWRAHTSSAGVENVISKLENRVHDYHAGDCYIPSNTVDSRSNPVKSTVKSGARSVQITEKQRSVHTSHVRLRKHKLIKQNRRKKKDNINPSQDAQVTHPSPKRINTRIHKTEIKEEIKPHQ